MHTYDLLFYHSKCNWFPSGIVFELWKLKQKEFPVAEGSGTMWIALCRPLQWFWKGVIIGLMWLRRFVNSHTVFTNTANVSEGLALWPGYQLKLRPENKPSLSGCSSQCLAWGKGGSLSHLEPGTCWGLVLTQRSSSFTFLHSCPAAQPLCAIFTVTGQGGGKGDFTWRTCGRD